MGITDVFKTKQFKNDIEKLTAENDYLNSLLTPEMKQAVSINKEIQNLQQQKLLVQQEIEALNATKESLNQQIVQLNNNISQKKETLIILDDEELYQDFGLYTPVYNLMNSESYKDRISVVREQQKAMIKNNTAAYYPTNFTYNNSLAQGKKLVADNVKQILRAFNNECDRQSQIQ